VTLPALCLGFCNPSKNREKGRVQNNINNNNNNNINNNNINRELPIFFPEINGGKISIVVPRFRHERDESSDIESTIPEAPHLFPFSMTPPPRPGKNNYSQTYHGESVQGRFLQGTLYGDAFFKS